MDKFFCNGALYFLNNCGSSSALNFRNAVQEIIALQKLKSKNLSQGMCMNLCTSGTWDLRRCSRDVPGTPNPSSTGCEVSSVVRFSPFILFCQNSFLRFFDVIFMSLTCIFEKSGICRRQQLISDTKFIM